MNYKCSEIESMMNWAGAERVPFLFGLDFEIEDGFFIENPMLNDEILFEVDGIGNYNANQLLPKYSDVKKQNNDLLFRQSEVDKQSGNSFSEESDVTYHDKNYKFEIFPEEYLQSLLSDKNFLEEVRGQI